jgi:hypothetical protein
VPGTSSETFPTSNGTYGVGDVKFEGDRDMQEGEEEVNVETESDIGSEEEKCVGIKGEEGLYSEEEEENVDIKEEDIDIKEEVSSVDTV